MNGKFVGTSAPGGDIWSNPNAWRGGHVPHSGNNLHVLVTAFSDADLETADNPFMVRDIIGADIGLGSPPSFSVTGFLHARDVCNFSSLETIGGGSLTADNIENVRYVTVLSSYIGIAPSIAVRHNIENVQQLTATEGSVIHVGGSLVNVGFASVSFGAAIEIGHKIGNTSLLFGIGGGTIILDHPKAHAINNPISLAFDTEKIELGDMAFNAAQFVPSSLGSPSGAVQLTQNGRLVETLTNVTLAYDAKGDFSVGIDNSTGYNSLLFKGGF